MSRAFLTKTLMLFLTALLAGCGGGGAFTATTGTGTGTGTTTPNAGNATLSMTGQTVIPVGQKSTTLTFTFRNENATPITNGTLTFTVSGSARIGGKSSGSFNTDANGNVSVTVEDTVSEAVLLSITPSAPNTTFTPTHLDTALYFSPVINAFISNNGQPANGTAAAKLTVRIQDQKGYPFVGVSTALAFSPKSFATAVKVPETTDEGGLFVVDITDTVAETLMVYPALGGYVLEGLPVTFTASTLTVPSSVNLTVSGSPALADGTATVDLTVIARDASGTPIADAEVVLASSSGSAVLGAARGKTGSNGVFQTTIKNSVAESVIITPTVGNVQGIARTVVFSNSSSSSPVSSVTVSLNGNPRPASGTDAAILTIFARNASGDPVVGADVSLKVSGGSAVFTPDSGKTDNLGRFVVNITDKVAETFNVTPVVANVAGATQTLTFTAIPSSSTAVPDKVTITAANNNQAADGKTPITLNIVVRDANNIPLSGVDVTLSSTSSTALLTAASGKTNSGGSFTTTVTDSKAETFTVTASSGGKSASETVTFGAPPNVSVSQITITDNNKLADGKETITVTALVRDAQNQPAVGIPMVLAFDPTTPSSAIPDKSSGVTGAGGEFVVKLTDTKAETFRVIIGVSGTAISKTSGSITFIESTATVQPSSLELLTSSSQLASEGKADGIVLTAILKTKDNNPYKGGEVRFSSDSGTIQPITMGTPAAGTTNESGQAQARLTTEGNPINRDITVTAKSGELVKTLVITVDGTVLSISGQGTVVQGNKPTFTIFLKDSAGKGIPKQEIKVVSLANNTIESSSFVTNETGIVIMTLSTNNITNNISIDDSTTKETINGDKLTISLPTSNGKVKSIKHYLTISKDDFKLSPVLKNADGSISNICLNSNGTFNLDWATGAGCSVGISTSRGKLVNGVSPIAVQIPPRSIPLILSSDNSGPAILNVSAIKSIGCQSTPSASLEFSFIATTANKVDLQAEPATVSANLPGKDSEQSTIIAIVRDAKNNLVEGKRVEFTLNDVTGGRISPSYAITDQYGRATISYIAGESTGANKEASITAKVDCKSPPNCQPLPTSGYYCDSTTAPSADVKITVARRQAFIVLGTGNKISAPDTTKYQLPFTSLVTDVNGNPIKGAVVDFTVIPTRYMKGWWEWNDKITPAAWTKIETVPNCSNEDKNRNSILDTGEDINNNGQLDPRNIATLANASGTGVGNSIKIATNENGFADFNLLYPKNYSTWVDVQIVARTIVAGTESEAHSEFRLDAMTTDFSGKDSSPPSLVSPYGVGANKFDGVLNKWLIDENDTKVGDFNRNGAIENNLPATCESSLVNY